MRLTEPGWWYRETPASAARVLGPVAAAWGAVAERRYRRAAGHRLPVPVVCVGNFTVGGTGKTPLAILIAGELDRLGARPAFLSRGYGGRLAGPHWVAPGYDTAAEVGDEPLLLARTAPALIARDRAEGGRAIVATGAGHGAIVMDDGLQNGSLAKDLVVAVVDGRRGVGNGLVMPAGPLRAPLGFQLSLVDAVLVNQPEQAEPHVGPFTQWLRDHFGGPVLTATTRPVGDLGWVDEGPLLAFSGIGAPERFFGLVERLGGDVVARRAFGDHHAYSEAEAGRLLDEARRSGATLCTTEKDWVRLTDVGALGALKAQAKVLAVRLDLGDRDGLRLRGLVEALFAVGARGVGAGRVPPIGG